MKNLVLVIRAKPCASKANNENAASMMGIHAGGFR